jgi:hypothetical protein
MLHANPTTPQPPSSDSLRIGGAGKRLTSFALDLRIFLVVSLISFNIPPT